MRVKTFKLGCANAHTLKTSLGWLWSSVLNSAISICGLERAVWGASVSIGRGTVWDLRADAASFSGKEQKVVGRDLRYRFGFL